MSGFGRRGVTPDGDKPQSARVQRTPRTLVPSTPNQTQASVAADTTSTPRPIRTPMPNGNQYANTAARPRAVSFDDGLRRYMIGVYNMMMLGVAFSGLVAMYLMAQPDLLKALTRNPLFWVTICGGTFALSFFSDKIIESKNPALGHLFFWTYAALWGAGLAPMLAMLINADAGVVIARAFFLAASLFGAASVYGYVTKKDLSGLGGILCMLSWGLIAATIMNFFIFKSNMFSLIVSYVIVVVFTGVTAWETQYIKDMYNPNDDADEQQSKSIFGAFQLYGSFMVIFSRLLRIMWSLYDEYA